MIFVLKSSFLSSCIIRCAFHNFLDCETRLEFFSLDWRWYYSHPYYSTPILSSDLTMIFYGKITFKESIITNPTFHRGFKVLVIFFSHKKFFMIFFISLFSKTKIIWTLNFFNSTNKSINLFLIMGLVLISCNSESNILKTVILETTNNHQRTWFHQNFYFCFFLNPLNLFFHFIRRC